MTHALVEAARDLDPLIRRHADEADRFLGPITYVDAAPPIIDAWRRHEP